MDFRNSCGVIVLTIAIVAGCSEPELRREPSSVQSVVSWLSGFRSWAKVDFSASQCEERLKSYYHDLEELRPSAELAAEIRSRASETARGFFEARQELREGMYRLYREGTLSESCVNEARNVMRVLRYTEEFIAEDLAKPAPYNDKKPYAYLGGETPYLQSAAAGRSFSAPSDLRSGDIILSRGEVFASAAIARMSKVPGQFSHGAFIYIEPSTKKIWVLEAHIEVGSQVRPYEEYARSSSVRAMVLRMRSSEEQRVAAEAAEIAFRRLTEAAKTPQKVIPYDFFMDLADDHEFFCTEIPYYGFKKASQGKLMVPLFLGRIEPKNRDFVDRLGIRTNRSFLPSDMDVDPRFEVIAEWRDLSRIASVHRKDAVLDRFYSWADDYGYKLQGNLTSWLKKSVVWRMRRWPLFSELLESKFPLNMPQSVLEVISVLNELGDALEQELERGDQVALKKRGLHLTISEMESLLEAFRLRDLQRYQEYRRWEVRSEGRATAVPSPRVPQIHLIFRPDN